ncbi:MAG: DUF2070 family protein [Thermoproteota archaeon]
MQSAIRRYKWVVGFPSFRNLLVLLFATSFLPWIILIPQGSKLEGAFAWVSGLALVPLLLDGLFIKLECFGAPILDRRRLIAISVVCNGVFSACILVASILAVLLSAPVFVSSAAILGSSVSFFVRIAALSTLGTPRIRLGTPSLYLASFAVAVLGMPETIGKMGFIAALVAFWFLSAVLYFLSLRSVNKIGARKIGVPSLAVFNAYMQSRLVGSTRDFETILDRLGEEKDVDCWLSLFKDGEGKNMLGLACTSAHFGPFDNVGSGSLSHELRLALEAKLQCPVVILRALSDHGMDLTSKNEREKLIEGFPLQAKLEGLALCSPLVTEKAGNHAATSLVADGFCLTILSRSPIPTEDMPRNVRDLVFKGLIGLGIKEAIIVDAHNCIGDLLETTQDIDAERFVESATKSVANASKKLSRFQLGFCRIFPNDISVDDGLGPDGISAIAFRHEDEVSSIVVLDGNNMVVGLSDKIKAELRGGLKVSSGEVVTTHTHIATGLSRVRGGYNPLGAKVGQDLLAGYCKEAVSRAILEAKPARISVASGAVKGTRVAGQGLAKLAELLDESVSATKRNLVASLSILAFFSYVLTIAA